MVWNLLRSPVVFFDANPIGTILTRFSKDITVTDFMLPTLTNFLLITGAKIVIIAIFVIISVPWNLISIVFIALPAYLVRRFSITAQNDSQRVESMSKGPINTRYSSAIDGITSIRAYRKQDYFIRGFMRDSDLNSSAKFTYNAMTRWSGIRYDFLSMSFMVGNLLIITILVNYFSVLDKNLAALTIQFAMDFAFTLSFFIRMVGEVENLMTCAQRVMEYAEMETEDELKKPNDPENWPVTSDIYFKDVVMRYRPHLDPVLKGLTYHIKSGQKVGIIGRTGAGKSSIMQALFRLVEIDSESSIIIGGEDTKEIGLH